MSTAGSAAIDRHRGGVGRGQGSWAMSPPPGDLVVDPLLSERAGQDPPVAAPFERRRMMFGVGAVVAVLVLAGVAIEQRSGGEQIAAAPPSSVQTETELGSRLSGGCQRQANRDGEFLWVCAPVGTKVVVI